jgi:hypothetical protein
MKDINIKRYVVVSNKGLIQEYDLTLLGSSTKRGDDSKIGMFGSGWKYALSYLMRNKIDIRIFSGTKEIKIDTNMDLHRNMPVEIITIDGKPTSLTTEAGPKWTGWMAIREIVSNAIDEPEYYIDVSTNPDIKGAEGRTTVFVSMEDNISHVINNFDKYFAFERKPTWEFEGGRLYHKEEKSEMVVYRKGIRCSQQMRVSTFDVDFDDIGISEDRIASPFDCKIRLKRALSTLNDTDAIFPLLDFWKTGSHPSAKEASYNNAYDSFFKKHADKNYCPADFYATASNIYNDKEFIWLPIPWYKALTAKKIIRDMFERRKGAPEGFIEVKEHDINVSLIKYHLKRLFHTDVNVCVGYLDSYVKIDESANMTVYISQDTTMPVNHIIGSILYQCSRDTLALIVKDDF